MNILIAFAMGDILLLDDVCSSKQIACIYWSVILINFNKDDLPFCELIWRSVLVMFMIYIVDILI